MNGPLREAEYEQLRAEPETLDAWEKLAIGFVAAACVFSLRAWWRVG